MQAVGNGLCVCIKFWQSYNVVISHIFALRAKDLIYVDNLERLRFRFKNKAMVINGTFAGEVKK